MDVKKYAVKFICALVYVHMILIIIAPFNKSILYRSIPEPLIKYLNQIGLNNPWNMFSPDPIPQQKIELTYFKNKTDKKPEVIIEEPKDESLYGLSRIRQFYLYNFFAQREKRIYKELGPMLCKNKSQGQWILTVKTGRADVYNIADERVMDCD